MTYKELTKRIENINEEIKFMEKIRDMLPDHDEKIMCGNIVNHLVSWRNTLMYDKEYEEVKK